jgi:hypothetical protein
MGKAEALQTAQNQVRTDPAHPEWAHPYYWAAFVLSGDAGPRSVEVAPTPEPRATSKPTPAAKKTGSLYSFGAALLLVVGLFVFICARRASWR